FLLASISCSSAFGQAHQKGDILLSPGISLGNYGYYHRGACNQFGIPLVFYADFSPHDYASVGPFFGIYLGDGVAFDFGARGSFHWWQLLDDKVSKDVKADILDLYFSFWVGAEISTHDCYKNDGNNGRGRAGAMLGLRWYFAEPVALMFELGGPPMGFTTLGVTFKL
ncbi:MAG TPA: hypothetical protein VNJ07_03700, partial [Chitinophagales bacterium]|nr:hypothetical protein [Chitinophagales bacterium]